MIASMIAWVSILESDERLKIVSGALKRVIIGVSISSAELSKNEMTVLSAVRKIETCSTLTPRFLEDNAECFSMKAIRSSFGPP